MIVLAEKKAKSEVDLRKLMDKMGLKPNAFAEICGFSKQSLAQFLRPGKSLTTNTIYRIANALDIDPRDMFFPTEEDEDKLIEDNSEETDAADKDNNVCCQDNVVPSTLQTTTFCPHCGTKVKIGVVMIEA